MRSNKYNKIEYINRKQIFILIITSKNECEALTCIINIRIDSRFEKIVKGFVWLA